MLIREVTVGEDLRIEVNESPHDFVQIAAACRPYEDASTSTYQVLLGLDGAVPEGDTGPRRKQRRRLYLVCLALEIEPSRYGLDQTDRAESWPGDQLLARAIGRTLGEALVGRRGVEWAARDLNSEPAESQLAAVA